MAAKRFTHIQQFTSDNVNFAGAGIRDTATSGQTKNVDYTVPFDVCLTGAVLIVVSAQNGDKATLQIIHPNGSTILNEFITDWGIATDQQFQFSLDLSYPANIASGLIIRVMYEAAGILGTRTIMCNYFLHKVIEQV